eukprot:7688636-Alexandrium_andersonii.AAC.1
MALWVKDHKFQWREAAFPAWPGFSKCPSTPTGHPERILRAVCVVLDSGPGSRMRCFCDSEAPHKTIAVGPGSLRKTLAHLRARGRGLKD